MWVVSITMRVHVFLNVPKQKKKVSNEDWDVKCAKCRVSPKYLLRKQIQILPVLQAIRKKNSLAKHLSMTSQIS